MKDYFEKIYCKGIFEKSKTFINNNKTSTISYNANKTIFSRVVVNKNIVSNDFGEATESVIFMDVDRIIRMLKMNKHGDTTLELKYGSIEGYGSFPRFINIKFGKIETDFLLTKGSVLKDPEFPEVKFSPEVVLTSDIIKDIKNAGAIIKSKYLYYRVNKGVIDIILTDDIQKKKTDTSTIEIKKDSSLTNDCLIKLNFKDIISVFNTYDTISVSSYSDKGLIMNHKSENMTSELLLSQIKK